MTGFVRSRLGQLLARSGIITPEQLEEAMRIQESSDKPLGRILVDLGYATQRDILSIVAMQVGVDYVDFDTRQPAANAIAAVPREAAVKYHAMPVELVDGRLLVAMNDPRDVVALDDLRAVTGHDIVPAIATREDIDAAIQEHYKVAMASSSEDMADLVTGFDELSELKDITSEAPAVKLVNFIIEKAVSDRASDIHVEPQEHDLRVRFRVDGVLHEVMRSPRSTQSSLISRLKIMADMDIADSRRPQDGHCAVTVAGHRIDLRVSTLPTVYGERVVLRILRKDSIMLELSDLGFLPDILARFESSFRRPYGAILVTGPTGSGKSTTLYATVNVLNDPGRHLVTAEDPVEYRLDGVNQCQMNVKAGFTFARALRSFLRCSPDVILVGEVRDRETAKIAIESALTGHLVLTTLHTNDAPSAITRLIEMGVEPFLVSSAVDCVLAQRLARKLCSDCKEEWSPSPEALIKAGYDPEDLPEKLYRAVGCKRCGNTGYRGRVGVHEVLLMSDQIAKLTVEEATTDRIKKVAREEGMLTLREDGLAKVRLGLTSIEEVVRVIA